MEAPVLSVVVSVYNNLPYLRDTMESVLSQDLDGMEVIVIDDVSTDGSYEYVSELAAKDGRIRLYRHGSNTGVHISRLEGMEYATGKYLWFVDGDDTLVGGCCRTIVSEAERHGADIFHFGTRIVNEGGIDEKRLSNMERFVAPYDGRLEGRAVFDGCFNDGLYRFSIWNKLYRTDLLRKVAGTAERVPLTKAQDKYEYFIISYLAASYHGDPSVVGYEYHFGTGITGHNVLTLEQFGRYCDMSLVADAAERFADGTEDAACVRNRRELLADCVANWYRLRQEDRPKGFDMMVSAWGGSDVIPLLAKRDWYDPGAVARAVRDAECLRFPAREVKTVATYYHKFTNGGVQRVISGLLHTWTEMGYKVVFITDEGPSDKDYPMPDSVKRVVIPSYFETDRENYGVRSKALSDILAENRVDVLVDHAWVSDTLLWDTLVCKASGVACVSYCHNIFAMLERNSRSSFASLSDIYRLMDGIVTLSDVDTRFWRNFNDNVREFLNPLTFDPRSVEPAVPADRTVLWLGRMSEEKKPKEAVNVFRRLKESVPDARMVMVGDGTPGFMKDLREYIDRNGLTDCIELPGYSEDVSEHYRKAAVFLCTSEFEGFLLTLSESLSYGVPCVIYDLPYLKMVREGDGFITVPQKDSALAAEEVAGLLQDEGRRSALGMAGREYMLSLAGYDYAGAWKGMFDAVSEGVPPKGVDETSDIMWSTLFQFYKEGVDRKNRALADIKKEMSGLDSKAMKAENDALRAEIASIRASWAYKTGKTLAMLAPDIRKEVVIPLVTGTAFSEGLNIKKNPQKAISVLRALAEADPGYTVALCDALSKSGSDGDRKEAYTRCIEMEEKDARAMALLARMCLGGIGTEKNPSLALTWADLADLEHQRPVDMFDILWKIGTPETCSRLVGTIAPSAEKGDLSAIGRLAKVYYEGKGAEKDLARAAEILRPVSRNGSWPNLMFDILWEMDDEETYGEMFDIARNASEKGDERAMCRLARCYRDGKGVGRDIGAAIPLMEKAVEADSSLLKEFKALKRMKD